MIITIGVDVGQRVDPTALVITELQWRPIEPRLILPGGDTYEDHHTVRYMERLPLGTPYPDIAARIAHLAKQVEEIVKAANLRNRAGWLIPQEYAEMRMYVDATGVGQPVVDILATSGVRATAVYFTGGDKRIEHDEEGTPFYITLGKGFMVARLQGLMQSARMHLPRDVPEAEEMARELRDFEIKVTDKANEQMGAFRVGTHDDYVTALGLSCNRPVVTMMGAVSSNGHIPMQVPEWAGGYTPQELSRINTPLGNLPHGGAHAARRTTIRGHQVPGMPNPFRTLAEPYDGLSSLGE